MFPSESIVISLECPLLADSGYKLIFEFLCNGAFVFCRTGASSDGEIYKQTLYYRAGDYPASCTHALFSLLDGGVIRSVTGGDDSISTS